MTTGSTTATGLGLLKTGWDIPAAERKSSLTDQLLPVAGMRVMAETTGPSFAVVGNVNKMEVSVAVPKIGVNGGLRKFQQFRVVALQAEIVGSFLVREIHSLGIRAGQHPEVIGSVGVMAGGAGAIDKGAMEVLLVLQLCLDILQRWPSEIIHTVTTETQTLFTGREKSLGPGKMGGMTTAATPPLVDGLVFVFGFGESLPHIGVAIEAEIRHLFFQDEGSRGGVGIVTVGTGALLHRRMDDRRGFHLFGEILVAMQAELAQGTLQKRFLIGLVGGMTGGAGPDGGRTVRRLKFEGFIVMAFETESGLIFTDVEKKSIGSPVRMMTGGAITIRNRRVDHLFFVERIMTLVTERRSFFNQFKTFTTLDGMLRSGPGVAGEALSVGDRLMLVSEATHGLMAFGGHTGIGMNFDRCQDEKAKHRDKKER